ncbi:hypothetical protein ACFY10_53340, partial [Streptomyces sp. NPDC001401]
MPDNSLFIAGLTGVTAISASSLASWLTSRGNAHAARIQVDATTEAQRREGIRQTREKSSRPVDQVSWAGPGVAADGLLRFGRGGFVR